MTDRSRLKQPPVSPRSVGPALTSNPLPFDLRPIAIGEFSLRARAAVPVGRPSLAGWQAALTFASAAEEASPYWIGDLMRYAENRADWRQKLSQAMSVTGLEENTLHDYGYVCRHVAEPARTIAPTFSHAKVVADCESVEQHALLAEARTEGLTRQEFRERVKRHKRQLVLEGQATLEGMYRVIYADPPWRYDDNGVITDTDAYGRAERHYPSMTIEELCKFPVAAHAMRDAVLFLWVTSPLLSTCWPVIEAWGFTYKTSLVWDKVAHNFGHYVSVRHELLLICTRGSCTPDRPLPMPDSVQTIRRGPVHSAKPREFRLLIERLYEGPRMELFARERVEGWDCYGNDPKLWSEDARRSASA